MKTALELMTIEQTVIAERPVFVRARVIGGEELTVHSMNGNCWFRVNGFRLAISEIIYLASQLFGHTCLRFGPMRRGVTAGLLGERGSSSPANVFFARRLALCWWACATRRSAEQHNLL
ncbi:hypothetical protein ABIA65_000095 [Mycolicibacterium sp. 624]